MSTKFLRNSLLFLLSWSMTVSAQQENGSWKLEAMPRDLEMDFALSALPPHLRGDATVYVLNPAKGYEVAKQGSNGFTCFVSRTEWEWVDFRSDHAAPISFDAEGSNTILPVYLEVARLRASGKSSPSEIKKVVLQGFNDGKFKPPSRSGVSYMLAPMMRTYPGPQTKDVMSMNMPHYMFYAPHVTDEDIGGMPFSQYPFVFNPGGGPDGYIILLAGESEKRKILEDNKDLLRRLVEYRDYFRVQQPEMNH